ncbi:MAG: phosphotransferase, partial [Acidimicrobiia bacterium]|nr:phosphotransferase [Acidimicrobiia bacterium]
SLVISLNTVLAAWEKAKTVPNDVADVWIHGDIHARNIIVADGRFKTLVDWGDMCVGDPAADIAAAWMLFPISAHCEFRDGAGPITDATWERARGSAIALGVILVDAGDSVDPAWAESGRRVLERACGAPPST